MKNNSIIYQIFPRTATKDGTIKAATKLLDHIADLDVEVLVEKDGQEVDGASILGLMMLAASKGSFIKVSAQGKDAETAIENITALVNSLFGEEQ